MAKYPAGTILQCYKELPSWSWSIGDLVAVISFSDYHKLTSYHYFLWKEDIPVKILQKKIKLRDTSILNLYTSDLFKPVTNKLTSLLYGE